MAEFGEVGASCLGRNELGVEVDRQRRRIRLEGMSQGMLGVCDVRRVLAGIPNVRLLRDVGFPSEVVESAGLRQKAEEHTFVLVAEQVDERTLRHDAAQHGRMCTRLLYELHGEPTDLGRDVVQL